MRHFSDFEKEILSEIASEKPLYCESEGTNYVSNDLGKIAAERLDVVSLELIENGAKIKVVFIGKGDDNCKLSKLFEFFYLIKYLENTYLLGLSPLGNEMVDFTVRGYKKPDPTYTTNEDNLLSEIIKVSFRNFWSIRTKDGISVIGTTSHLVTTTLGKDIIRYLCSQYYPSQELKQLVANDFKSSEQIYTEQQLDEAKTQTRYARNSIRWAIIAVILAIASLLATVITPNCTAIP